MGWVVQRKRGGFGWELLPNSLARSGKITLCYDWLRGLAPLAESQHVNRCSASDLIRKLDGLLATRACPRNELLPRLLPQQAPRCLGSGRDLSGAAGTCANKFEYERDDAAGPLRQPVSARAAGAARLHFLA